MSTGRNTGTSTVTNMAQRAYTALKTAGINAYFDGQHVGLCKEPYASVSDLGRISMGKTLGERGIRIMGAVPIDKPTTLAAYMDSIKTAMEPLGWKSTGEMPEAEVLDDEKAIVTAVTYSRLCG